MNWRTWAIKIGVYTMLASSAGIAMTGVKNNHIVHEGNVILGLLMMVAVWAFINTKHFEDTIHKAEQRGQTP